jgi:hypothetical protein
MSEDDVKNITKIGGKRWLASYLVPSGCGCMPPSRHTIIIESDTQPTKAQITHEIRSRNKRP